MSKSFIVIIRRAWCNEGWHGIEYSSDLIHYETRNGAISHGFRTVDSDDFNIGVIDGGKLISFDWMDKPVGESEDTLAQIAELIGLGVSMTTDITELAQMKGQKVEGSYYLAECTDCGKMYPSNKLNGGEPLFSGDYGECYCPHCNADDAAIGDCGDTAAIAWNYQQGRIDALVEALEKAQQTEKTLESRNRRLDGIITAAEKRIAELESRTVTVKLPDDAEHDIMAPVAAYLSEKFKWNGSAVRWDGRNEYDVLGDRVKYALRMVIRRAAGIKWEAE